MSGESPLHWRHRGQSVLTKWTTRKRSRLVVGLVEFEVEFEFEVEVVKGFVEGGRGRRGKVLLGGLVDRKVLEEKGLFLIFEEV